MLQRGAITLVFDDGYEQIYTTVVPFLNSQKIPGVFAIPLNHESVQESEGRPTVPWSQWKEIEKNGHEIAAHSISHADLTSLSLEQLTEELSGPVNTFGATTLVYPGGAHNDQVVEIAQRYYKGARTVLKGFERLRPANAMRLKTYNFTHENFTVWKANLLVLWAWITNKWLIETYHLVDDPKAVHSVSSKDLVKHISFIQRLPIPVRTIRYQLSL